MRLGLLMSVSSPWAREAARQLTLAGNEVHVIDFERSGQNGYLRIQDTFQTKEIDEFCRALASVHWIMPRGHGASRYILCARTIGRLLRRLRVDVALALYGGGFSTLLWLSGFRPYASYVVGSDVLGASWARRRLLRRTLGSAVAVYSNGKFLAASVREAVGRSDVTALYLGVDLDLFRPAVPAPSPVHIVCTRGFMPIYNNSLIVEAIAQLPPDVPEFKLTFCSAGPELPKVRDQANSLPTAFRKRIHFLGGVTQSKLVEVLRNSHVYISMSRSDGTSTSLLEAMACGLYPLLSDIPGNREWIDQGMHGVLVEDAVDKLAAELAKAMRDCEQRASAAHINRHLVATKGDCRRNMIELSHSISQRLSRV